MTTDPFTDAATSAYEDYVRTPKMNVGTFRDRIAEAYMDAAEWARTHLAAQEPTDAECVILLRVMYPDIPFNSPSHYPDAMERARAAIRAVRAARRDEEKR